MTTSSTVRIPHLEGPEERPIWSVMIPTFNCARYLRQTLESVLCQDPGPEKMQIEVVDDCSTSDDPESVVRELAGDRVSFYRQPVNVGHVRNFNSCLLRSRGRLVHLLHGDDAVRPDFYKRMQEVFEAHPEVGAAICRYLVMDEEGHWQHIGRLLSRQSGVLSNWLEKIATGQRLQAPSIAVRRAVYENVGGFDPRIRKYGEDWEMWVRIAAHYPVWYEPEPLAIYRIHSTSLSGQTVRTGENATDLRRVIEINKAHLPAESVAKLSNLARKNNAHGCLRRAFRFANQGAWRGAFAQIKEALRFTRALDVIAVAAAVTGFVILRAILGSIIPGRGSAGDRA